MLRSTKSLRGYRIETFDGECGRLKSLIVSQDIHHVKALLAEAVKVFSRQEFVIPVEVVRNTDWDNEEFSIAMDRSQVLASTMKSKTISGEPSSNVMGFTLEALGDRTGWVHDLIVDVIEWKVRYFVVSLHRYRPSHLVLVAADWTTKVDWNLKCIHLDHDRQTVRHSPRFDSYAGINRDYENRLYDYYGRAKYWESRYPGEFKDRASYRLF